MLSFYRTRYPTGTLGTACSQFHVLYTNQLPVLLLSLIVLVASVHAFTFRFTSPPTQCADITAIWEGGAPPYTLLLLPIGFLPQGVERRVIFQKEVDDGNEVAFKFPFPGDTR